LTTAGWRREDGRSEAYVNPIDLFAEKVKTTPKAAFLSTYPDPFLLHLHWTNLAPLNEPGAESIQFRTVAASSPDRGLVIRLPPTPDLQRAEAAMLAKDQRNPYSDRIYIGRASNNDIVVRQRSISKAHAYFRREAPGAWTVVDCGSHNQTVIDGAALPPNQPRPVSDGMGIYFGNYLAFFVDASRFYGLVQATGKASPSSQG
jgi:hypothetical protein